VPVVFDPELLSGAGKRLAGRRSSKDGSIVWPSGEAECETPAPDAGEEVVLGVSSQVIGAYLSHVSFINVTVGDVAGSDQVAQPLRCVGVELVIVCA